MTILTSDRSYEPELQTIATELLAATRENRSLFAQLRDHLRWDDKILAWTMENPNLRVQLFRFIDCLPALKSKSEISRHLQEYLGDASVELPSALKALLGEGLTGQVGATTIATAIETLAHQYIAGENIHQIVKTVAHLRQDQMTNKMIQLSSNYFTYPPRHKK